MSSFRSPQWWNLDWENAEPVEQILSESTRFRFTAQIPIRCRHEPHVDSSSPFFSNPFQFSFLKHSQQLGLEFERNLSDLVQKQRSPVR